MQLNIDFSDSKALTSAELGVMRAAVRLFIERMPKESRIETTPIIAGTISCASLGPTMHKVGTKYRIGCSGLLWHFLPMSESEAEEMWERWIFGGEDRWEHLPGGATCAPPASLIPFMWAFPQQLAESWGAAEDFLHAILNRAPWLCSASITPAQFSAYLRLAINAERELSRWQEKTAGLCAAGLPHDALAFVTANAFTNVGYQRGICKPPVSCDCST